MSDDDQLDSERESRSCPQLRDGFSSDCVLSHTGIGEREALVRLFSEITNGWFVTLGFRQWVAPNSANISAGHFLMRIQRYFFGSRFYRSGRYFTGYVVAELKTKGRSGPCKHYHFVLVPVGQPTKAITLEAFEALVRAASTDLSLPTLDQRMPIGRRISGEDFVDVQAQYDSSGLATYVTKTLRPGQYSGFSYAFIGPEGVVGWTTRSA